MPAPGDQYLPIVGINDTTQFTDLTLHNAGLGNLRLSFTGSEETAYYVNNSSIMPGTPDITVYNGPDKKAPVIAVSHLTISRRHTVGVGDYSESDFQNPMLWETLQRASRWKHSKYHYEFCFGGGLETRTKFEWNRVKRKFTGGYCLQLIELSNPAVVLGAFIPGPGMRVKIKGRLLVRKGYGEAWERMAILTGLALVELTRRRVRARKY